MNVFEILFYETGINPKEGTNVLMKEYPAHYHYYTLLQMLYEEVKGDEVQIIEGVPSTLQEHVRIPNQLSQKQITLLKTPRTYFSPKFSTWFLVEEEIDRFLEVPRYRWPVATSNDNIANFFDTKLKKRNKGTIVYLVAKKHFESDPVGLKQRLKKFANVISASDSLMSQKLHTIITKEFHSFYKSEYFTNSSLVSILKNPYNPVMVFEPTALSNILAQIITIQDIEKYGIDTSMFDYPENESSAYIDRLYLELKQTFDAINSNTHASMSIGIGIDEVDKYLKPIEEKVKTNIETVSQKHDRLSTEIRNTLAEIKTNIDSVVSNQAMCAIATVDFDLSTDLAVSPIENEQNYQNYYLLFGMDVVQTNNLALSVRYSEIIDLFPNIKITQPNDEFMFLIGNRWMISISDEAYDQILLKLKEKDMNLYYKFISYVPQPSKWMNEKERFGPKVAFVEEMARYINRYFDVSFFEEFLSRSSCYILTPGLKNVFTRDQTNILKLRADIITTCKLISDMVKQVVGFNTDTSRSIISSSGLFSLTDIQNLDKHIKDWGGIFGVEYQGKSVFLHVKRLSRRTFLKEIQPEKFFISEAIDIDPQTVFQSSSSSSSSSIPSSSKQFVEKDPKNIYALVCQLLTGALKRNPVPKLSDIHKYFTYLVSLKRNERIKYPGGFIPNLEYIVKYIEGRPLNTIEDVNDLMRYHRRVVVASESFLTIMRKNQLQSISIREIIENPNSNLDIENEWKRFHTILSRQGDLVHQILLSELDLNYMKKFSNQTSIFILLVSFYKYFNNTYILNAFDKMDHSMFFVALPYTTLYLLAYVLLKHHTFFLPAAREVEYIPKDDTQIANLAYEFVNLEVWATDYPNNLLAASKLGNFIYREYAPIFRIYSSKLKPTISEREIESPGNLTNYFLQILGVGKDNLEEDVKKTIFSTLSAVLIILTRTFTIIDSANFLKALVTKIIRLDRELTNTNQIFTDTKISKILVLYSTLNATAIQSIFANMQELQPVLRTIQINFPKTPPDLVFNHTLHVSIANITKYLVTNPSVAEQSYGQYITSESVSRNVILMKFLEKLVGGLSEDFKALKFKELIPSLLAQDTPANSIVAYLKLYAQIKQGKEDVPDTSVYLDRTITADEKFLKFYLLKFEIGLKTVTWMYA